MEEADDRSAKQIFDETPDWYEATELSDEDLDPNFIPPKQRGRGIPPDARRVRGQPDDTYRLQSLGTRHGRAFNLVFNTTIFVWIRSFFIVLALFVGVYYYGFLTDKVTNVEQGECFTAAEWSAGERSLEPRISDRDIVSPVRVSVVPCDEPNFGEVLAVVAITPPDDVGPYSEHWDDVRAACARAASKPVANEGADLVLAIGQEYEREGGNHRTLCVAPSPTTGIDLERLLES